MTKRETKFTQVGALGEFGLIQRLTKNIQLQNPSSFKGVGDDAAVISATKKVLISTDLLLEGIHFDLIYCPLKHLGFKCISVNVSDIYAMNAQPEQVTVSLGISQKFSVEMIEELYAGIYAACEFYGVDLVGGDTTASINGLQISVTAIGQADENDISYRNGAKEGDFICVSGNLGAAFVGLQLLEREKHVFLTEKGVTPDLENQAYVVGRQLKPYARKDVFENLQKLGLKPTSMIDISDGLSSELTHICSRSGVGCLVEEEFIPIHEETYNLALKFHTDPIVCACNGGEDYELLFTINPKDEKLLELIPDVNVIGKITSKNEGLKLISKQGNKYDLLSQGWVHLKADKQ